MCTHSPFVTASRATSLRREASEQSLRLVPRHLPPQGGSFVLSTQGSRYTIISLSNIGSVNQACLSRAGAVLFVVVV